MARSGRSRPAPRWVWRCLSCVWPAIRLRQALWPCDTKRVFAAVSRCAHARLGVCVFPPPALHPLLWPPAQSAGQWTWGPATSRGSCKRPASRSAPGLQKARSSSCSSCIEFSVRPCVRPSRRGARARRWRRRTSVIPAAPRSSPRAPDSAPAMGSHARCFRGVAPARHPGRRLAPSAPSVATPTARRPAWAVDPLCRHLRVSVRPVAFLLAESSHQVNLTPLRARPSRQGCVWGLGWQAAL